MENLEVRQTSLFDVIRDLRDDIKSLITDEIQLAKTELSQKFSRFSKNGVWLLAGGILAYTGALLLLAGIGALLAFAFASAGLSTSLAWFLGLLVVGLIVAAVGGAFVMKALKTFSHESITPEKTVESLNEIRGTTPAVETLPPPEPPKRSTDEIQSHITATRNNMGQRIDELSERLTPRFMGKRMVQQVTRHPIRSSIIGAGTGLVSYFAIKKRLKNHENKR